jgi:DNA-binding transcriptional MocR family regulator
VFVEDPTYFLALGLLSGDLGLRVVPVGMDGEGLDLHQLEEVVVREKAAQQVEEGRFWAMVYTIPNYHNPTGLTMSKRRGRGLIQLAARHDMLVLCDDVYNLLSYSPAPYSRLRALEEGTEACVISNGSLSKVLAPGVRLGWIEAPPAVLVRLAGSGLIQSGGCMNQVTSATATSLVSLGLLDAQLETCLSIYSGRMDSAVAALRGGLPPGWTVAHPGGGYFLWVTGPGGDLSAFCSHLKERGVAVLPGARAGATSGASFRLSVAHYSEERIVAACGDIATAAFSFFQSEGRA